MDNLTVSSYESVCVVVCNLFSRLHGTALVSGSCLVPSIFAVETFFKVGVNGGELLLSVSLPVRAGPAAWRLCLQSGIGVARRLFGALVASDGGFGPRGALGRWLGAGWD